MVKIGEICCEVCGMTSADGAALFRQNEKGVPGVWRCHLHNQVFIDPKVKELTDSITNTVVRSTVLDKDAL